MATIEKAIQIAARARECQKDKDGEPYILHPLRVMSAVEGEPAKVAAVLHDVIEDTAITAEDLRREGFGEAVLASVTWLTHREGEPYADYVVRCKGDEIVRRVKLADLEDNARPDRIEPAIDEVDLFLPSRWRSSGPGVAGRSVSEPSSGRSPTPPGRTPGRPGSSPGRPPS